MEVQVARLEEIPPNASFQEYIGILTRYLELFRPMWPYYWLKAIAVYDPATNAWQLYRFLLAGRWNEISPVEPIYEQGSALTIVSQIIDASTAWAMLASLQESGTVHITTDITASVVTTSSGFLPIWQEAYQVTADSGLATVTEPASWRYLYDDRSRFWTGDGDSENRLQRAVLPDLQIWGERDIYTWHSRWLGEPLRGGGFHLSDFRCQFDFPLAFDVERVVPDREGTPASLTLMLSCRQPLMLDSLQVKSGARWSSPAVCFPSMGSTPRASGRLGR